MTQPHRWLQCRNQSLTWRQIWKGTHGQDLIEYALMAGLLATSAGAVMPRAAKNLDKVFNKVKSVMKVAAKGN